MTTLEYAGLTDVGRLREHNEDAFGLMPDDNLFVVADGLGGYAAGEVASKLAVDTIAGAIRMHHGSATRMASANSDRQVTREEEVLVGAVESANQRVHSAASRYRAYRGMATTVVSMRIVEDRCVVAHVGDSRCYRLRSGVLTRMTEDHSLLNEYKRRGNTDVTEETFPLRNIIMRAIGKDASVKVDVSTDTYLPGDVYILCTDGLTGELNDLAIATLAQQYTNNLNQMSHALVNAACDAGGRDNVTIVAVKIAA